MYPYPASQDIDFKAEVIAAEMVESGIDAERILLRMLGAFKRPHSKDIQSITSEVVNEGPEYFFVDTPRESLYDMLPEGLFHKHTIPKRGRNAEEINKENVEGMRAVRKEEEQA